MREAIFEGKSEEEALLKASEELGCNIAEMTYEVIDVETGLFGLFGKLVKMRVRAPDQSGRIVYREGLPPTQDRAVDRVASIKNPDLAAPMPVEAPVPPPPDRELPVDTMKGPDALKALRGLLEHMDVSADIRLSENEEGILLSIDTADQETVIGRDGEVLAALQFLVNKIVNRYPEGRKLVVLDSEGFRNRREVELGKLAHDLGNKAIETNKVVRLSPMNAQDRRLVHLALKDFPGLSTRSEGEGSFRCLLIVPDGVRERRPRRDGPQGERPEPRERRD